MAKEEMARILVLTKPHRPHTSVPDTDGTIRNAFVGTAVCVDPMQPADYDDPSKFRFVPTIGAWDREAVNMLGQKGAAVELPNWPEIERAVAALRAIHGDLPVVVE